MKIIKGWNGARWLWIAIESAVEGKERDVAFTSWADAVAYRCAINAARKGGGSMQEVEQLRAKAFSTYGYNK